MVIAVVVDYRRRIGDYVRPERRRVIVVRRLPFLAETLGGRALNEEVFQRRSFRPNRYRMS